MERKDQVVVENEKVSEALSVNKSTEKVEPSLDEGRFKFEEKKS